MAKANSVVGLMDLLEIRSSEPPKTASRAGSKIGKHARLATDEEFAKDLEEVAIDDTSPIPRGGMVMRSDGKRALIDTSDSHNIVISSTGSRKTTLLVIPSIYTIARAGECALIADPKGEIYDASAGAFKANGYNVARINFRDVIRSSKWNPLLLPYQWFHSDDANLHNMGETMLLDFVKAICPIVTTKDPYWEREGQNTLMGCALVLFRKCGDPAAINFRSLSALIRCVADKDQKMVDFIDGLEPGDEIRESLETVISLPDSTRHCVIGVASAAIAPYTVQDSIASLLSEDEIRLDRIADGKNVIFITTPDERTTYNAIVSCFVKQSYEILITRAESCEGHALPRKVNYILDEFASFPKITDFDSMISAARSRNIRFTMILQGLTQLYGVYGDNGGGNIWGNCANTFFFTSREDELLDSIVKLGGKKKNGDTLFTVASLQRLDKDLGECIVFHNRCHPYISRFVMFDEWADRKLDAGDAEAECRLAVPKVFDLRSSSAKREVSRRGQQENRGRGRSAAEFISALQTIHRFGEAGAIARIQSDTEDETDFHRLIDGCIADFDFAEDFAEFIFSVVVELAEETGSRDKALNYIDANRCYFKDYPIEVVAQIQAAYGAIRGMSDAEFELYAVSDSEGETEDAVALEDTSVAEVIDHCIRESQSGGCEQLSYEFFEALIIRHVTRAEIKLHAEEYKAAVESLGNQEASEAMDLALHRVDVITDEMIEDIRKIITSD